MTGRPPPGDDGRAPASGADGKLQHNRPTEADSERLRARSHILPVQLDSGDETSWTQLRGSRECPSRIQDVHRETCFRRASSIAEDSSEPRSRRGKSFGGTIGSRKSYHSDTAIE
ncbi:hypothetical protein EYF80_010267 [Liparis tanakae]|uniref:Uncharacterized protein n=1 Tax=Liparis tanakae TaxID=230148 RepID=A0A4Z2IQL6_9TELE|nr:hypothetical protein EYF80_010267 [Liparis tanakae]